MYGLLKIQKSVRPFAKRNWVAHAAALVPWFSSRMIYTHIHFQIQDSLFIFLWQCQWIFPQQLYTLWMNMLYSIGVKHLGGKFLINKSHS